MTIKLFGENSSERQKRIKKDSPFQSLKSWNLIRLIIKTNDNLKQEQFAMQLVSQFNQIFQKEKLKLQLTPYEVISIGHDCGIIEMVENTVTFDKLKHTIYHEFPKIKGLGDFFKAYFGKKRIKKARSNFCQSLAAYSLVCYFLQLKDRHNGNILFKNDGSIVHIDFGFFLSNSPGKGIELEKLVPFKFISDYVDILGGVDSKYFKKFRVYFLKGFKAAKKHQESIITLVKMMYTSHGEELPCFEGGERCVEELELRFNPERVRDIGDLNIYIQNMINESLDNYRTRWYDKFQYYLQGIFY